MTRPISHPATQRRFDLAQPQPGHVIAFLAELRDNLPSREHGLVCETAVHGDQAVYVARRPSGGYTVRHFPGAGHGDHRVMPESDEHKRGKEYTASELDRNGLPAAQEVRTDNGAVLDVATLDSPRIIAVEFQAYNNLDDRGYKARTTRIANAGAFTGEHARPVAGGVLPVWVHAFGLPGKWTYPVPSIAAQDTSWQVMPKPGTVTAIGPRVIEARRCEPGGPWDACPVRGRNWCGKWHPWAMAWAHDEARGGLKVGEATAMAANKQLVPLRHYSGAVYLVTPEHAALYAELGGTGTWKPGPAGERQSVRQLGSCQWRPPYEPAITTRIIPAVRPVATPPAPPPARSWQPWRCNGCGGRVTVGKVRCDACIARGNRRAPLEGELGPWGRCSACSRRYRPVHPAGLCYECARSARGLPA